MAAVTQTKDAGATLFNTDPRVIDDSSDRMSASAYSHDNNEASGNWAGEIVSRILFLEALAANRMWETNQ